TTPPPPPGSAEPEPLGPGGRRRVRAGGAQPDGRRPPVDGTRRLNLERDEPTGHAAGSGCMRRRRQVLQVSTFPFLAVLLCAMGSLILLLLVIDRRAKAVARAKALQALARVSEEDAKAVAARKAEYARRRQSLHALLLQ